MKYLKQLLIILAISFVGEALKYFLPLPIPASIYGMVLLFILLLTGVVKLDDVQDVGKFLIEIMPVMFIPAGVGLMASWGVLKPMLVPVVVIIVVSLVFVMGLPSGSSVIIRRRRAKTMNDLFLNSAMAGVTLSLVVYMLGCWLKKRTGLALFNPLLLSIIVTILVLIVGKVDYDTYNEGAKYLSWFLTPATVSLAIPLYEQLTLLRKNFKAVMAGIVAGVLSSLVAILVMSVLLGLSHTEYVTLLPKSITTAIGMGVAEELDGYVTITVAAIVTTGVLGNILAEPVLKLFRITEPIAKGVALGSSAHAIGTAKAMELGDIEGAMSSLSIAVAGLLTVIGATVFSSLY